MEKSNGGMEGRDKRKEEKGNRNKEIARKKGSKNQQKA